MTTDANSMEIKLRIRARYLCERDGQPEDQLANYLSKAKAMLDEEALINTPIDEATAAGSLLTKPLVKENGSR